MLRRNASDSSLKSQKIPIRSARPSRQQDPMLAADRLLRKKYLDVSVGAFHFRHLQRYLQDRARARELQALSQSGEYLRRVMSFAETRECIRGVVTQRVERDYLCGVVFHGPFFAVLEKRQRLQRRLKQRNLYNRYYFSSCPPKISVITQPTATTLRPPESNSTLELQALTKNLQAMLVPRKKAVAATPQKRLKQKSEKSRRVLRMGQKQQEETYGLKNYRKGGGKLRVKAVSREKESLFINIKYCVTPQPHSSSRDKELFSSPSQGRLSERKVGSSRSGDKRRKG